MSDFNFDQDDFFEDYEDEEEAGDSDAAASTALELSQEEIEKRMAAFEKEQKRKMHIASKPKQFNPEQRKEAVRWLGEAGHPGSVPVLLKVYQKDRTPGMKEEAAFALGQIKALGQALEDPDPVLAEEADALFNDIILHNKFGKRVDTSRFGMIEIGLGISAGVIFVLAIIMMIAVAGPRNAQRAEVAAVTAAFETQVAPTPTEDTQDIVEGLIEDYYAQLLQDANTYQLQLVIAGRGESIDCSPDAFKRPEAFQLSDKWASDPNYAPIVQTLNSIRDALTPVRQAYDNSCSSKQPISREETLSLGTTVLNAQSQLRDTETLFTNSGLAVPTVELASATPQPTEIPLPSATPDVASASDTIDQLDRLISDMLDPRGAASNVVLYWEQTINANEMYREGCNEGQVTIPDDYTLSADLQATFPHLDLAVQNLNVGLQTLRQTSAAFFNACAAGALPDDASQQLTVANLAKSAFQAAQVELGKVGNP